MLARQGNADRTVVQAILEGKGARLAVTRGCGSRHPGEGGHRLPKERIAGAQHPVILQVGAAQQHGRDKVIQRHGVEDAALLVEIGQKDAAGRAVGVLDDLFTATLEDNQLAADLKGGRAVVQLAHGRHLVLVVHQKEAAG